METLDPSIVNVARAIRDTESGSNFTAQGKSGEFGAYQFMPQTWNGLSQKYLGQQVDLSQATPEQQNAVAYNYIKDLKSQGNNVGQIASIWNSGKADPNGNVGTNSKGVSYDTPTYVQNVYQNYLKYKQTDPQAQPMQPQQATPPTYGAIAPASTQDNPLVAGVKAAVNLPSSALNLGEGLFNAVSHPIDTLTGLGRTAVGGVETLTGAAPDQNTATFDAFTNALKQRYGSLEALQNTATNDPFGFGSDVLSVLTGGAALADRAGLAAGRELGAADALDRGITTVGGSVAAPIQSTVNGATKLVSNVGRYLTSQLTGLEPQNLSTIMEHPDAFTPEAIANNSRQAIAQEVEGALQKRIGTLQETGSGYDGIRATEPVDVSRGFLDKTLRSAAGVEITDGEIVASGSSKIRRGAEITKLQDLYDLWKPVFQGGKMTGEQYLNFRSDLADLAYNEAGRKSTDLAYVADQVRQSLNSTYRSKLPGLESLDADFSAQKTELGDLRKGLIDKDGNLTDAAVNKIANATGAGKDKLLARLEDILPGVTKRIQIQKAMEDIQKASGIKVGTYARSATEAGGAIVGLTTGNIPLLAGSLALAIITSPAVAVPLLRVFGFNKPLVTAVLGHLSSVVSPTAGAIGASALSRAGNATASGALSASSPIPANATPVPAQ